MIDLANLESEAASRRAEESRRVEEQSRKARDAHERLRAALTRIFRTQDGGELKAYLRSQVLTKVYEPGDSLDIVAVRDGRRGLAFDLLAVGDALED